MGFSPKEHTFVNFGFCENVLSCIRSREDAPRQPFPHLSPEDGNTFLYFLSFGKYEKTNKVQELSNATCLFSV
jgi:hypothetical protein